MSTLTDEIARLRAEYERRKWIARRAGERAQWLEDHPPTDAELRATAEHNVRRAAPRIPAEHVGLPDHTEAVQAMVDAGQVIPAGVYRITRPIIGVVLGFDGKRGP